MNTRPVIHTLASTLVAALLALPVVARSAEPDPDLRQDYQLMLEEAERARIEAEEARAEAGKAAELAHEMALTNAALARQEARQQREREDAGAQQQEQAQERARQEREMERVREELSRAHRELREASREIAVTHRKLAGGGSKHRGMHRINLGDRAVIGVVLGQESADGVKIIGVSPGGPAERAGLQIGDVLLSIRGENLAGGDHRGGRETLFRVMEDVTPDETIAVVANRGGEILDFDVTVERREPSSWQTMIRIPEAPLAPDAPRIVVERVEVPQVDHEAINARIAAVNRELESQRFVFVSPEGGELEIDGEFPLPEDFDIEIAEFSELAGHALKEANVWFGLPYAQGLELAEVNEGLGAYFKTDRGVLVLQARPGNAYQLEAGDVVLDIKSRPVNSPADLMRALREIEPGAEIEITIKRERKDKTLNVVMPENRLGHTWPHAATAPDM
jgi:C-terminal processing protease CtpA/Prc